MRDTDRVAQIDSTTQVWTQLSAPRTEPARLVLLLALAVPRGRKTCISAVAQYWAQHREVGSSTYG
eukprot:2008450-Rhodomonas_salina.1